ncbi:MAG: asparagine synthase (glutamine-hydrolyzing) [Bacteroidetes bacterium]|nr:asparagine synthase (glutamine-hydrolyzing) [Bacteroidota bacterium]
MCRIAGIADKAANQLFLEDQVKAMCLLQKHGGPDDEGIYSNAESKLVLGHRRLALLDLSPAGHQPMIFANRFIISFNGEIYNFPDLKNELQLLGQKFYTHSDTEVILAAFAQWGTQAFSKLKGMFAFALFDNVTNQLYLVRDPSGIKPLYYFLQNNRLEFASEIRAFKATGTKNINKNWPVFQLAYGHLPEPVTTLQDVKPLHKGCFLQFDINNGTHSLQSFTHYSYLSNKASSAFDLKNILKEAVGRHLLSDAPIGVFLSGGIDSGIISLLAAEYQKQNLNSLSLYFEEAVFSEKLYQDLMIKKLQCSHHQHLLTQKEFNDALPKILQDMDMPSCDGINTWFISKYAAAQGLKAVLSGIGGDELFGGYPSFRRMRWSSAIQKIPASLLKAGRNSGVKRLRRLQYLTIDGIKGQYLFLRGQNVPDEIAEYLEATEKEIWDILKSQPISEELALLDAPNRASWMEMNMYMQNQLLRDADVMSMAHGIEIRVPMLDDAVVKNALAMPSNIKYHGALPKQILIDTFINELPQQVWDRPKMGFAFPFTQWLGSSAYVEELMQGAGVHTRHSYEQFKNGKLHWSKFMSLIMLQSRGIAA